MSSSSGLLQPSVVSPSQQSPEANVATLYGSFQGNGASNPSAAQNRGNWFSTITHVGTGHYRVQINLKVPVNVVAVNGTGVGNGNPNGLIAEARAWAVCETLQTAPTIARCATSKYDSNTNNPNTFDVFTYINSAGTDTLTDVTSSDRICFALAWKQNAATP